METHCKIKEIFLAVLIIFLLALLPYIIDIIKNIINSIKCKSKNLKKDIKPKTQQETKILTQQEKKEITRVNLKRIVIEFPELAKKNPYLISDFKLGLFYFSFIFKKNLTKDFFLDNDCNFINTYKYALFLFPYLYNDNKVAKKAVYYLFSNTWGTITGCKYKDVFSLIDRIRMLLDNDLECNEFDFETNKIIK